MWYMYFLLAIFLLFLAYRPKPKSLRGCRVLLTGAGRGLGKALAIQLAREGCSLVLWDIKPQLLAELKKELDAFCSIEARIQCVDVSDEKAVSHAIKALESAPVDIVINNAGLLAGKHFTLLDVNEIRRTMDVNAMGPVWVLKHLLPSFLSRKSGHIVTICSVLSQFYAAGASDYCMSKSAVAAFHNCLRLELRRLSLPNLKTTLVLPYTIDTGMFKGVKQPRVVSLIFPSLSAEYVAQRVIQSIKFNEEVIVLPYLVGWATSFVGLLPVRLRDLCTEYVGGGTGMDSFIGHGQG